MSKFTRTIVRISPDILVVIAAFNLIGGLSVVLGGQMASAGPLFGLSAALGGIVLPLTAAAVLGRYDEWLARSRREDDK